jgi:hypothetical protein
MDCLIKDRRQSCGGYEPPQSPALHRKIDMMVHRSFDDRLRTLEPDLVNRIQSNCVKALIPDIMSRVELSCNEMLKSMEPEFAWRVGVAVQTQIRNEKQKTGDDHPIGKILLEPAPEPHINGAQTQDTPPRSAVGGPVLPLTNLVTNDKFKRLESDVNKLSEQLLEFSTRLAQLADDAKARSAFAPPFYPPADAQLSSLRELSTVPQAMQTPVASPKVEPEMQNMDEFDNVSDAKKDAVKPPITPTPVRPESPPLELLNVSELEMLEDYAANTGQTTVMQTGTQSAESMEIQNWKQAEEQKPSPTQEAQAHRHSRFERMTTQEAQVHFQHERVRHDDAYKIQESQI